MFYLPSGQQLKKKKTIIHYGVFRPNRDLDTYTEDLKAIPRKSTMYRKSSIYGDGSSSSLAGRTFVQT